VEAAGAVTAVTIIVADMAEADLEAVDLVVVAASEAAVLPEAVDPAEGSDQTARLQNRKKKRARMNQRVLFFWFYGMMVVSEISMLLMMIAAVSSIERLDTLMTMQPNLLYKSYAYSNSARIRSMSE
jgi:hypothetical protein